MDTNKTNDKDVEQVTREITDETKAAIMDFFSTVLDMNINAGKLDALSPETRKYTEDRQGAETETVSKMINTALDDLQAGVIDNELIGEKPEDAEKAFNEIMNSALDSVNDYLDEMNTRLEAALNSDNPEEINDIYKGAQDYAAETGPELAEKGLKNLKAITNAMPPETQDALRNYGVFDMIKQLMLTPLETVGDPEKYSEDFMQQAEEFLTTLEDITNNPQPVAKQKPPTYFYSPTNAVARNMAALIDAGPIDLVVAHRNEPGETTITAEVTTASDVEGVEIIGKWEEFDNTVMDAITTLAKNGYRVISADMIYRVIAAKTGSKGNPSKQMEKDITNHVEKQRRQFVKLDLSREREMRKRERPKSKYQIDVDSMDDNILNLRGGDFRVNGHIIHGWYIKEIPIIAQYSEMTGQCITINQKYRELIAISDDGETTTIAANKQRVSINEYMWRYISVVKREREKKAEELTRYNKRREKNPSLKKKTIEDFCKLKPVMLYDTILDAGGIKRSHQNDINFISFIKTRLDAWKKQGLIADFKELPGKRKDTARGVEFMF